MGETTCGVHAPSLSMPCMGSLWPQEQVTPNGWLRQCLQRRPGELRKGPRGLPQSCEGISFYGPSPGLWVFRC